MSQATITKTKHGWLVACLACSFAGLTVLMVAAGSGQAQTVTSLAKIHDAEVIKVKPRQAFQKELKAYGRIEASRRSQTGFELAGTVLAVEVDEGDNVQPGEILARLDTQRLIARMRELDAALARAEADARLADLSERRVAELVRKKLESTQRLDEVREATIATAALAAEIQARKDSLNVELRKSVLRAPFAGNVIARPVDPGTVVSAGQMILELQQTDDLEVRIALPADDAFNFKTGETYVLRNESEIVSTTIKSIAKQRKLNTRTVDVIFTITDDESVLLPGDLLALSYIVTVDVAGTWVPKKALNSGIRGLWILYTVQGTGQQALISKAVEVLHFDTNKAFVRGAISSDDYIVINGIQRFVPGQLVRARVSLPPVAWKGE